MNRRCKMTRQNRFLGSALALALVPLVLACDDSLTGPESRSGPGGSGSAQFAIEPSRFEIEVGETIQLTAVYGDRAVPGHQVLWLSSAPVLVEVADGSVRGLSEGGATITAKYAGNIAIAYVHVVGERDPTDDGRVLPQN
jgi:hypothetical protein